MHLDAPSLILQFQRHVAKLTSFPDVIKLAQLLVQEILCICRMQVRVWSRAGKQVSLPIEAIQQITLLYNYRRS